MDFARFLADLDALLAAATKAFDSATDVEALDAARIEFIGTKSGRVKSMQEALGSVAKEDKPTAGKRFNELKRSVEEAFEIACRRVGEAAGPGVHVIKASGGLRLSSTASVEIVRAVGAGNELHLGQRADAIVVRRFDPTLPGQPLRLGKLHPITQTIEELKDIMGRLGFSPAEGPEIEDEYHNFEALNIPLEHPARDPLDNFYLSVASAAAQGSGFGVQGSGNTTRSGGNPLLLRSQTSTVQIRVMEQRQPPVRIISLGRVYRPDAADATHYPMFHQMEGLLIDRQVTMADLKSVLRMFATSYLGEDVHIRFRPSFFPFTEPSVEADMHWHDRWIEFGGAGMVDPNVLSAVGYDPEVYSGFAFGLGIERLCMRRHGITDIREFYKNDVRFLAQF